MTEAGKGDSPRKVDVKKFDKNRSLIKWKSEAVEWDNLMEIYKIKEKK